MSTLTVRLAVLGLALLIVLPVTGFADDPPFPTTCTERPFELNPNAATDRVDGPDDFLPCSGFAYALCYYSGPEPMPCRPNADGTSALCACSYVDATRKVPVGPTAAPLTDIYFVDKTSILNRCIAAQTLEYCTANPDACAKVDGAPVCWYIANAPELFAADGGPVDAVSTFSLARVSWATIGCTNCPGDDQRYAGCMTAPCRKEVIDGETVAMCNCPIAEGTFQVGQNGMSCEIDTPDGPRVWSASASSSGACPQTSVAEP